MSTSTTTTTGPEPVESAADLADRHQVQLNDPFLPAPEPVARPDDGGPPVVLRTHEPAPPAGLDEWRVAARQVGEALYSPDAITLDDALDWVEANDRERSVISAKARRWDAEHAVRGRGSYTAGRAGGLETPLRVIERGLQVIPKLNEAAAAKHAAVAANKRLSAVGKADEDARIGADLAAEVARAVAEPFDNAAELLRECELAHAGDFPASKPKTTSHEERLVEFAEAQALILAAKASGNDSRMGALIEVAAALPGAEKVTGTLLKIHALSSLDVLKLRLVVQNLRQRTDARRAQLLGDPKALDAAVGVAVVRRVQAGLRSLRSFVEAHPGEDALARQQLAKIFRGLRA